MMPITETLVTYSSSAVRPSSAGPMVTALAAAATALAMHLVDPGAAAWARSLLTQDERVAIEV